MVKHRNRLPREVIDPPCLFKFKRHLDTSLNDVLTLGHPQSNLIIEFDFHCISFRIKITLFLLCSNFYCSHQNCSIALLFWLHGNSLLYVREDLKVISVNILCWPTTSEEYTDSMVVKTTFPTIFNYILLPCDSTKGHSDKMSLTWKRI